MRRRARHPRQAVPSGARAPRLAGLALACALGALAIAGCGVGPGESSGGAAVTVTRDFGAVQVGAASVKEAPGSETVMRLLQRNFKVTTRYGGGFVQSINGLEGGREGGLPVDWFYYVNGIEAPEGASATKLHEGDRIWWDRHAWGATQRIPAVVGSYPEPFRSGVEGKLLPVRLECDEQAAAACDEASRRLGEAGAKVGRSAINASAGNEVLRVVVGRWSAVRGTEATRQLDRGPQASGVFARFTRGGRGLEVLDVRGGVARRLGSGAGLIAATRLADQMPTWVVAGTDAEGALAAARALTEETLRNRFALAVAPGGAKVPAPSGAAR